MNGLFLGCAVIGLVATPLALFASIAYLKKAGA